MNVDKPELLLSLPLNMSQYLERCEPEVAASAFFTSDPPGNQLGSGGGTAHVLAEAWQARRGKGESFSSWLARSSKVIVHGGGQSRRLPAYAGTGKLFVPVPAFRWSLGQRLDQTLLDLQLPFVESVMSQASAASRVAIASGDVLLRSGDVIPALPDADIVLLGLWTRPEDACHFGVMFCDRNDSSRLRFFLQKPSPDEIRALAAENLFMIDVGLWLLSERAVMCLMQKCGWDASKDRFVNGAPDVFDLYGTWGPSLGESPAEPDDEVGQLTTAVVPIASGAFYHFGRSRDIIGSVYELQNLVVDQTTFGSYAAQPHPRQFVQNADFRFPLRQDSNHTLWVENSVIPDTWCLHSEHLLTGVPENDWAVELPQGVCLDFAPMGDHEYAVRPYGIDDSFRGSLRESETKWMGESARCWFEKRGISLETVGLDADIDIQDAPIFPVVDISACSGEFITWLCSSDPQDCDDCRRLWVSAEKVSATFIAGNINLERLYAARRTRMKAALPMMMRNYRKSVFYRLDLEHAAALFASKKDGLDLLPDLTSGDSATLRMHDCMLRSRVMRLLDDSERADAYQNQAFEALRDAIVTPLMNEPVLPRCAVVEDQIVWGRSPARLDLAGGWTDTPPYCMERGGAVINLAVDLNGQPPIQVFARVTEQHALTIRSIDLGQSEQLTSYEEVEDYGRLASGFTVARAALALIGFHPRFNGGRYQSLEEQLRAFGGGVEVSMLAAIPKGSGLGTSSILAATLLGTLSNLTALDWDRIEISRRTLALEQMLTSGGGWQDQVGGIFPGIKLVETSPGIEQGPVIRWVTKRLFSDPAYRGRMLLYYTGVTRVAHNLLSDIVSGIFLNSNSRLAILDEIGRTAHLVYDAFQREDIDALAEGVRRSWRLNQQLNSGTNVPEVQAILDVCGSDLAAAKLLGAGGGGYLYMIASSEDAANRIRNKLEQSPPNERARFVEMSISETGFQVTRS